VACRWASGRGAALGSGPRCPAPAAAGRCSRCDVFSTTIQPPYSLLKIRLSFLGPTAAGRCKSSARPAGLGRLDAAGPTAPPRLTPPRIPPCNQYERVSYFRKRMVAGSCSAPQVLGPGADGALASAGCCFFAAGQPAGAPRHPLHIIMPTVG
jgi:hypothetical protein